MTDFQSLATRYRSKTAFWTVQQRDTFDRSYDKPRFAIFHEPRCGKSKIIVDTCCYHWHVKDSPLHVTGCLIVAWPNGGHYGWVLDAFPESFTGKWKGFMWDADSLNTNKGREEFEAFLKFDDFKVFAVGADSLKSEKTQKAIGRFMVACGRIMAVGDESSFMVEEKALRTKVMQSISHGPKAKQYVVMRRILDGTPVDRAGPLDYYSQVGFLGFDVLGYPNPVEFRNHYAEIKIGGRGEFWAAVKELRANYEKNYSPEIAQEIALREAKKKFKRGDWWEAVAEDDDGRPVFRNMDELWGKLDPISSRETFAGCFPNAPRPTYDKVEFDLTPEQRRVYDQLAEEYRADLADGSEIEASHHLARMLRLQQVASNYYPEHDKIHLHADCMGMGCEGCDDTGIVESKVPLRLIDAKRNPRLDALAERLKQDKPIIVWARFKQDVDLIMELCESLGRKAVQYDGRVKSRAKLQNRIDFQDGHADTFVANQAAASRAIPLFRAQEHCVVSNIYSFRTRRQMEERAEHGRKTTSTALWDLVAKDTVDDLAILPALRTGMDVSTFVLKDAKRSWI